MQSPLKNIIPKEIVNRQLKKVTNVHNKQMTPQTSLLLVYNESPILKPEFGSFKGPMNSKKVIDFDE